MLFKKAKQTYQIENSKGQLADKQSPEISGDSKMRNCQKDKAQTQQHTDYIHGKNMSRHTQALKDTGQCGVQVEERTEETQGGDKISGQGAVE